MKKLISISTVIVVLILAFYFSLSGNNKVKIAEQEKPKEKASCCASEDYETSDFTENSIYQLNSTWQNQFDNKVELKDLKGKTQIIAMIFANCSYACPILVNDMKKIEKELSANEIKNVKFTLISIDPERDTPAKLKQFASDQNLNFANWQLLTGSRSNIDDFAVLLGFRYKKENDGSFSHSNIITILNEEGEIIHQQIGLNEEIEQTVSVIKENINKGV